MAAQFFIGKKSEIEAYVDNGNRSLPTVTESLDGENVVLDIIVVGGGIAGLSAAITLSRAGHNVTVLEKSKLKREAGFMITLGSNAVRVLNTFDFDFKRARAVDCNFVETFNGFTLERLTSHGMSVLDLDPNLRPRTFYRPDLHNELKRIALLDSSKFKSPTLRLGAKVASVDTALGTVTLEDGSTLSGDLIVGADGERSLVKEAFQDGQTLRQAPYKVLRAVVPREKLNDAGDKAMLAITHNKFAIFMSMNRIISWFEGQDGLLQDFEAGYFLDEDEDRKAETDSQKSREMLLEKFSDFHPDLVNALSKVEEVSDWEIHHSPPLANLYKGKAVLIGDAAHSMYPTTGQGACQSIEDVACLGVLLSTLGSKSEISSRLGLYQTVRKERASIVQSLSGIVFGLEEQVAKARPWHMIHKSGIKTTEDHVKYLYEYDVVAESRKALEEGVRARARL